MSFTVQQHHVNSFTRNVEHLLQQQGRKLTDRVSRGSYTGKSGVVVEQIGTIGVIRDRGRHTDTPHLSIPGDRRWVYPHSLTTATLLDKLDEARILIDLKSPYAEAIANSLGRAEDDEIGSAFFGAALTGENGTTPVTFPASQQVGVNVGGANSGLNVPKLRAVRRMFMQSGVDLARDSITMAITAIEHDNLLGELQVTSLDYNNKPTLVDGRVTSFMGINFVHVEWQATQTDGATPFYPLSLATIAPGGVAATARFLPAWVESGMHYGTWDGLQTRVSEREDKNYNWQIWGELMSGATRTQEKKVVQVAVNSA